MQISPFGEELTVYRIGRDDNPRLLITFKQIMQTACMVAMPMRNENIVNCAEVYAQLLCILDKHITCSSIKQNLVPLCFQQDRKPMLCRETAVILALQATRGRAASII